MKTLKKVIINLFLILALALQTTIASANSTITIPDTMIEKEYTKKALSQLELKLTPKTMDIVKKFQFYVINQPINHVPDFQEKKYSYSMKAITRPTDKLVVIFKTDKDYNNTLWHIYHESAHCLDYDFSENNPDPKQCGLYSNTDEYTKIAEEEWPAISKYSRYVMSDFNGQEEFAEAFTIYLLKPDIMRTIAPKTCAFIDKLGYIKPEELKGQDTTGSQWRFDNIDWSYYEDGKKVTGWKQIDGIWYYFSQEGKEIKNTKVQGYQLDECGKWVS